MKTESRDNEQLRTPVEIHLGCAADDGFAIPLAALLYSAAVNADATSRLVFHIIDGGISEAHRSRIEAGIARVSPDHRVQWYRPDRRALDELPATSRFPKQIYLRLLAPALLPQAVRRIIWLDADTLVEVDLRPLWEIPLGASHTGAVWDFGYGSSGEVEGMRELTNAYGLDPTSPYFNSGVLLIDLARWRSERICEMAIECIGRFTQSIRYPDQDALNAVCAGKWIELNRRWNSQMAGLLYYRRVSPQAQPPWFGREGDGVEREPWIIHFTTAKPWNSAMFHRSRRRYFRYLRGSGFLSPPHLAVYQAVSVIRTAVAPLHRQTW